MHEYRTTLDELKGTLPGQVGFLSTQFTVLLWLFSLCNELVIDIDLRFPFEEMLN